MPTVKQLIRKPRQAPVKAANQRFPSSGAEFRRSAAFAHVCTQNDSKKPNVGLRKVAKIVCTQWGLK